MFRGVFFSGYSGVIWRRPYLVGAFGDVQVCSDLFGVVQVCSGCAGAAERLTARVAGGEEGASAVLRGARHGWHSCSYASVTGLGQSGGVRWATVGLLEGAGRRARTSG